MGNVYRTYFKNNLFIRIILLFACITIITILTLSYLMYSEMSQSIVRIELENQRQAMESVDKYIDEKYNTVQSMISDVYRDQLLAQNIYYLLKHPYQDYIRYRLDQYYSNENAGSANALEYFRKKLDRDSDIHDLIVYSAESQYMYVYDRKGLSRLIQTNASRSYIPDVMAMNENGVTVPNQWIRNAIGEPVPLLYSVPAVHAPISLEGDGLAFSSMKIGEESGDLMLRWFNMNADRTKLTVIPAFMYNHLYKSNVLEQPADPLPKGTTGRLSLAVSACEIVTLGVKLD